jgi:hypothetical protein
LKSDSTETQSIILATSRVLLTDYTLVEQTDDTIYIRARFTKKGYYKLTIFSKFGEPLKFTEALILLIFNSNESETTSAFPFTYTTTRKYKCRLLEPLVRDIPQMKINLSRW